MPKSVAAGSLSAAEFQRQESTRPCLGVSSCLLGHKVRYDGEHQLQPLIDRFLSEHFQLIHFCPEMAIGLGAPRAKIQLCERNNDIVCLDAASETIDYTSSLAGCCDSEQPWLTQICGYVLKSKSPSCGVSRVKTRYGDKLVADGQGIFAREIIRRYPDLPLIEEDALGDEMQRREFITLALALHARR